MDCRTDENIARDVANAFGGIAELRDALPGSPFSTVYSWIKTGRIPAWRRAGIEAAAEKRGIQLPDSFKATAA